MLFRRRVQRTSWAAASHSEVHAWWHDTTRQQQQQNIVARIMRRWTSPGNFFERRKNDCWIGREVEWLDLRTFCGRQSLVLGSIDFSLCFSYKLSQFFFLFFSKSLSLSFFLWPAILLSFSFSLSFPFYRSLSVYVEMRKNGWSW